MKILITGAGGFIGSHLTALSAEAGHEVRAFVHYNSAGTRGWLDTLGPGLDIVAGDIRDLDSVGRAMEGMDCVMHLAALIGIPYSYVSPLAYVRTNVEGTYNVLESARRLGLAEVLVTSTSETYGTARNVPMDEDHPREAQSPYAATKIAADQLALSYHRSFGTPVKIIRPFNAYGPRQSARAVIPAMAAQLLSGAREIRLGNLAPTRDLTYVTDTASAFLDVLGADALVGEAVNVGMDEEVSIARLAELLIEITGSKATVVEDAARVRPAPSEVMRLRCSNARLRRHTAWRPRYTLREGLAATVRWIADNMDRYRPGEYAI